jgi:hypothetical protein
MVPLISWPLRCLLPLTDLTPLPLPLTPFQTMRTPSSAAVSVRLAALKRKPDRVTVVISASLSERLRERALVEGRSLSNLCAYLLEVVMAGEQRG